MKTIYTLIFSLLTTIASAQTVSPIKVNQVGYYPNEEKTAAIEQEGWAKKYKLTNVKTGKIVWQGKAIRTATSPWSGKQRAIIDFSSVTTPGKYTLSNGKNAITVEIKENALHELAVASMKSFYLQRTGEPILKEYAGEYARPAGHMDNKVMIHPSAATESRPAGTIISSPGGWYDAGDFNKYIVNSAYSVGIMLYAYELNKEYFNKLNLNIPESKNSTPDFLDEILTNLNWMLTMQDPDDGGVYHKLTTPNFEAFIMPKDCKQQRYVVQKSTAATLDFAATMALASRIYKEYPQYGDFVNKANRSINPAMKWATIHRKAIYNQDAMNKKYDPDVTTGTYGDFNIEDEMLWSFFESWKHDGSSAEVSSKDFSIERQPAPFTIPSWGNVMSFCTYTQLNEFILNGGKLTEEMRKDNCIIAFADSILGTTATSCYNTPAGNSPKNFHWGCLAESFCGQGIALLYAYRLTGDKKYLTGALQLADYILGRNATGYCYVTGFGSKPAMHPHQRLSAADGIENPLPGFLVGGPNPGQQDKKDMKEKYTSNYPDESYLDASGSYASNEIAINWNASLAAFVCWLDAELSK